MNEFTKQWYTKYIAKRASKDNPVNTGITPKSEFVDRKSLEGIQRKEKVEETYSLKFIEIEFVAHHGQQLDNDNREFLAKIFQDCMVNLHLAINDKSIQSKVTQGKDGLDSDNSRI